MLFSYISKTIKNVITPGDYAISDLQLFTLFYGFEIGVCEYEYSFYALAI